MGAKPCEIILELFQGRILSSPEKCARNLIYNRRVELAPALQNTPIPTLKFFEEKGYGGRKLF